MSTQAQKILKIADWIIPGHGKMFKTPRKDSRHKRGGLARLSAKPECPFGGYKKSGMGREYGEIGMKEFSQIKLIAVVKP